jgi:hypothetical protein
MGFEGGKYSFMLFTFNNAMTTKGSSI